VKARTLVSGRHDLLRNGREADSKRAFAKDPPCVQAGHQFAGMEISSDQAGPLNGGTMRTAGGLVLFGDDVQSFEAADAKDPKPLRHFNPGQDVSPSPMNDAIYGKPDVAIAAGSDIFSFALPLTFDNSNQEE